MTLNQLKIFISKVAKMEDLEKFRNILKIYEITQDKITLELNK